MTGFLAAFGFVLLLLALALRMLKRLERRVGQGRGELRLEVVQRLALGPRQGMALVRVGERLMLVSLGEGGVRPLLELSEEEAAALESPPASTDSEERALFGSFRALANAGPRAAFARQLRGAFRTGFRSVLLIGFALGAAALLKADSLFAQEVVSDFARADSMLTRLAPVLDLQVGDAAGGLRLSGTVGIVVMMGLLTLLPTLLLMMTSFTRILIVLHFLRQAIGTQSAPPAHLIAGLALLLTGFVMAPTFGEVNRRALQPWMEGTIEQGEMLATAAEPLRDFMLDQTRDRDLSVFLDLSESPEVATAAEVPLVVLMSAFVTSELRTAFQIGFALFLPFIVIDVVVASVLMSMGMFMLPPPMIALPFKILLFVLVDGWTLIVQGLVSSFA